MIGYWISVHPKTGTLFFVPTLDMLDDFSSD